MHNENNERSIGRLISILHRQSHIYFSGKLETYGLGHGQMPILMHVIHHQGVTQHDISKHFYMDKGSISSLLKSLEKHDFIYKEQDAEDKRAFRLYITEKTRKLMPEFRKIFQEWTNILLCGFSKEQEEQVFELLNRMIENTQKYFNGEVRQ